MAGRSTTTRARPRIRRLMAAATLSFGLLGLVVVASWIYTSTALSRATTAAIRHTRGMENASQLELSLLTYQRLGNMYVLTGEPELATARADLADQIDELSTAAAEFVEGGEERRLHQEVTRRLEQYLRERARLEALGLDLEDISQGTQPVLHAAVERLEALRALNEAQVEQAYLGARRLSGLSRTVGAGTGLLLAIGLLAAILGVRRYVLHPTLDLHDTVERFRGGDFESRATEAGSHESAELARAFNELADALLRQRQDQLEFLAGVAHDLRNPLGAIKLGVHALALEQSEDRRLRTLERLDRQGDRLARMVGDLLDATRIEAGQLELSLEVIDLRDIVDDIVRLYAPTSPDHDIVRTLPAEPVTVRGDALRLEQVASNLLSNAIKFSPGGGRIGIEVETGDHEVTLSVTDRGIGIPADELSTIFMPFRRRRPEVAPGAGLGLSVVRRIVVAHGGTIDVASSPEGGTTFRVRLPRAPLARAIEPATGQATPPG